MKTVTLNGTSTALDDAIKTIRDLIVFLKKSPEHVVVDCNQNVYKGTDTQYCIQDADLIEVVHFVGGGA